MSARVWNSDATPKTRMIRSTPEHLQRVLDKLDASESGRFKETRQMQRYRYRHAEVTAYLKQPGDSSALCSGVFTRNLSSSGIAFLYGSFAHQGSLCLVQLITLHGSWNDIPGRVIYCLHVGASLREVSVKFDRDIDPSLYVIEATLCHVLLADDDPLVVRLADFHLSALNARVDHAADGASAAEQALKKVYDLILMDTRMLGLNGIEAVALMRANGYTGPIVATSAAVAPEEVARVLERGFNQHISKPFSREELRKLLQSIRAEPVQSLYHEDPAFAELINAFVAALPPAIRAMEKALVEKNRGNLTTVARMLSENAGGYGFDMIRKAATDLESGLHNGVPTLALQPSVEWLLKLCRKAQSVQLNPGGTPSQPVAIGGDVDRR